MDINEMKAELERTKKALEAQQDALNVAPVTLENLGRDVMHGGAQGLGAMPFNLGAHLGALAIFRWFTKE